MSEAHTDASPANAITINQLVLHRSNLPFMISLASFLALLFLILAPIFVPIKIHLDFGSDGHPALALLAMYLPHGLLFFTTIASGYIGYKLVVASGASPENAIPPNHYNLLAPLIQEGKAESIDQYVRLSSLSGFTGTFTKLGLTGLPLTTVALTLIFAALALLPIDSESQKSFFDLTKLTLGAFIGSFVQRQVEQRRTPGPKGDESRTPLSN